MYCDNCHRQCPDNFVNCPYCSAPLKGSKRKKPKKFVKKKNNAKKISFRTMVLASIVLAVVLAIGAVVTGLVTGAKPETAIKSMVDAVQTNDTKMYFSLYDDQLVEYYKENWYYGDEETFDAITKPLEESRDFYITKCGTDFVLEYKINNMTEVTGESFEMYRQLLAESFNYKKLPSKIYVLDFEIVATGENGTYKSMYEEFVCIQMGGKWYIQPAASNILDKSSETVE